MKNLVDDLIVNLIQSLDGKWMEVTRAEIEEADGRRDRNNPICKTASCLYLAYFGEQLLYVGETSKSIKRRFISDGSGSHKEACANWYPTVSHVRFITFDDKELPEMHRKLIEQAISIHFKPKFYGSRKL